MKKITQLNLTKKAPCTGAFYFASIIHFYTSPKFPPLYLLPFAPCAEYTQLSLKHAHIIHFQIIHQNADESAKSLTPAYFSVTRPVE